MRSNIVSEASLTSRINQWWSGITFVSSGLIIICSAIYIVFLLTGFDSFGGICFLPSELISHFQVYRIYTSIFVHVSLLHVFFNMLALVPMGTELERIMGSVRLLFLIILLATSNAILNIFIALLVAHNPIHPYPYFMHECAVGFSGVLFAMIVIETSLSGVQSRSVFGLFNVPSKLYAWILLIVIQLLATNVSFLGHLCGILSGFAYTYGLFNYLLPGPSFYSFIESSSILSACLRRPGFILCTGGTPYGSSPHPNIITNSSGLVSQNIWRSLSSWMPRRETAVEQVGQDSRFPGRGRTLGSTRNQTATDVDLDSDLEARLLGNSTDDTHMGTTISSETSNSHTTTGVPGVLPQNQELGTFDEELKKLVSMGFEKIQAEVALSAADGDPSVAVEILMSQQQ